MSNATNNFSVKLNIDNINNPIKTDQKELDISMKCCNEILDIFRNNNVNMYESMLILTSLADSMYTFLMYGDEIDNILEK